VKIFVHEYAVGGGFSGGEIPRGFLLEGYAMLASLLEELSRLPGSHHVVISLDARLRNLKVCANEIVPVPDGEFGRIFSTLVGSSDAVFIIAPEAEGILAGLSEEVERQGKFLLGAGSRAVREAGDKYRTFQVLTEHRIPTPGTVLLSGAGDIPSQCADLNYPLVLKPQDGAGCSGVFLVRTREELERAAGQIQDRAYLAQEFVAGTPASVSLIGNGREITPLSLNAQQIKSSFEMAYLGGSVPLRHPLQDRAFAAARRACSAIRGLKGYAGVDLVLTNREAVVIEVNPRLTTSYLGLARVSGRNIAELILRACVRGEAPRPFPLHGPVSFSILELENRLKEVLT